MSNGSTRGGEPEDSSGADVKELHAKISIPGGASAANSGVSMRAKNRVVSKAFNYSMSGIAHSS